MDIVIFKDLTTNECLEELQVESEKYTGLYVDMENAPERKYVKDKADAINQLLKKINRKRIDLSKEYKNQVEQEAAQIVDLLLVANEPFTLLIDAHKTERAKVLDAEKARKQAILDAAQLELDHEMGLLINKTYEFDKAEEARILDEKLIEIQEQADKAAEENQILINEAIERDKVHAENARLTNVDWVRRINREIFKAFIDAGVDKESAKLATQALIDKKVPNTIINY